MVSFVDPPYLRTLPADPDLSPATRPLADRPACVQCTKAAVAKGFPADGVRCVYSAASVFATKDDVDFEQKVGGRGARCLWDSSSAPAITSTEVTTAAEPAPSSGPQSPVLEQSLEEESSELGAPDLLSLLRR